MHEVCSPMKSMMPLYNPLDPGKKYPVVFEKNISAHQIKVALRPLFLSGDWPDMRNWFMDEFAKGVIPVGRLPVNQLQETFTAMLECNFAQPFIGMLNDNPGFLIEISEGGKPITGLDEDAHEVEKGDHFIRVILSPPLLSIRTMAHYALLTSLEYFFSHTEVKRIVWELNERDKHYIHLANRLGFEEKKFSDWPGVHIFLYTKENFSLQHLTSLQ
jgi:hypothetical protein